MESSTAAFHIEKRRSRHFLSERARQHPEQQTQPLIRFELDEAALQHFCGCPTAHDESAHFFLSKTRPRTRHSANGNHQLQPARFGIIQILKISKLALVAKGYVLQNERALRQSDLISFSSSWTK